MCWKQRDYRKEVCRKVCRNHFAEMQNIHGLWRGGRGGGAKVEDPWWSAEGSQLALNVACVWTSPSASRVTSNQELHVVMLILFPGCFKSITVWQELKTLFTREEGRWDMKVDKHTRLKPAASSHCLGSEGWKVKEGVWPPVWGFTRSLPASGRRIVSEERLQLVTRQKRKKPIWLCSKTLISV